MSQQSVAMPQTYNALLLARGTRRAASEFATRHVTDVNDNGASSEPNSRSRPRNQSAIVSKVSANGSLHKVSQTLRLMRQRRQSHSPVAKSAASKDHKIHSASVVSKVKVSEHMDVTMAEQGLIVEVPENVVGTRVEHASNLGFVEVAPANSDTSTENYGEVNMAAPEIPPFVATGLRLQTDWGEEEEEEGEEVIELPQKSKTKPSRSRLSGWSLISPRRQARSLNTSETEKHTSNSKQVSNGGGEKESKPSTPRTPSSVFASMISLASPRKNGPKFNWNSRAAAAEQAEAVESTNTTSNLSAVAETSCTAEISATTTCSRTSSLNLPEKSAVSTATSTTTSSSRISELSASQGTVSTATSAITHSSHVPECATQETVNTTSSSTTNNSRVPESATQTTVNAETSATTHSAHLPETHATNKTVSAKSSTTLRKSRIGRLMSQMRSPRQPSPPSSNLGQIDGSGGGNVDGASLQSTVRDMLKLRRQAICGDD